MNPYREHFSPPIRTIDPEPWDEVYIISHRHPWKGGLCAHCYAWMDDHNLITRLDIYNDIVKCPQCGAKWKMIEIDLWFKGYEKRPIKAAE